MVRLVNFMYRIQFVMMVQIMSLMMFIRITVVMIIYDDMHYPNKFSVP